MLAVCPNPALDVTYGVADLAVGETHRVLEVHHAAGGKAVNVARVLARLGHPVTATGLAGGPEGRSLRDRLAADGVQERFVAIEAGTRRTVVVVDGAGTATGLWEPGPALRPGEWDRLLEQVASLASGHAVAVLSGSLPPGAPAHGYAELVALTRHAGCTVVLDADGDALRLGLAAGPDVVKPNAEELSRTATAIDAGGRAGVSGATSPSGGDDLHRAAAILRRAGAGVVVATGGPSGITALGPSWAVHGRPPVALTGNATGAGDAAVAAIARGLAQGAGWPEIVADAVALSAAAVVAPIAGAFSLERYEEWRHAVVVQEVEP